MTILEHLAEPIRSVQDWERRTRHKTPSDAQIDAFYDEQIALLKASDSDLSGAGEPSRSPFAESFGRVFVWLRGVGAIRAAGAGAVCAVAALALVVGFPSDASLTFTLTGASGQPLVLGAEQQRGWLGSTGAQRVDFSDGTRVTLADGAEARVSETTAAGAEFVLKRGNVTLDVVPRHGYNWGVSAGPFLVRVKGTVFDVAWDPKAEELDLRVSRGAVAVSGGSLQSEMLIVKGQRLVASEHSGNALLTTAADSGRLLQDDSTEVPETVDHPSELPVEKQASEEMVNNPAHGARVPRGTKAGVAPQDSAEAPVESADSLLKKADLARAAGDGSEATRLLLQVRQRFPGSSQASLAAYTLGVTAFMHRGSSVEGARWFQTYLRESPGGPLAREALGQLMEAQARMGNQDAARISARRYLELHPKGPHRHAAQVLSGVSSRPNGAIEKP